VEGGERGRGKQRSEQMQLQTEWVRATLGVPFLNHHLIYPLTLINLLIYPLTPPPGSGVPRLVLNGPPETDGGKWRLDQATGQVCVCVCVRARVGACAGACACACACARSACACVRAWCLHSPGHRPPPPPYTRRRASCVSMARECATAARERERERAESASSSSERSPFPYAPSAPSSGR
jgi:hypothetical protein